MIDGEALMTVAWLVVGVVLLAVELRHFAFFALFASLGSFAAAGVALAAPEAIPLQVFVAVVVAAVGMLTIRPMASEAFHRRTGGEKLGRGVHGTLVGEEVLTLDVVGDTGQVGHVRLAGERWLAVSGAGTPIPAGTPVLVTGVEGTTLVVWPVSGILPEVQPDEIESPPEPSGGEAEGEQP
jgi:membrane protein implicated in regulation of membrane protease activity